MKRCLFISLFFCLGIHQATSQSVLIKIIDTANSRIDIAYAKFYCGSKQDSLNDYKIVKGGLLEYMLKESCSYPRLVITASGYNEWNFQITEVQIKKGEVLCTLSKTDMTMLSPVTVTAKRNSIQEKNDTTTYIVSRFKDGTERKLDELLKKLPGIQVNDKTGEVKFKGKPIETILLEGDDLFGTNYTLATKNINANIINEIQAIENYSDNYVLKGLDKEEKVALNIKVTNPTIKISGAGETAIGYFQGDKDAINASTNIVGLGKVHKFFTTIAYNNVGKNLSPLDYFGNSQSLEQIKDHKYSAKKFINEPAFSNFLDDSRINLNSQTFSNYNGLFRISKKMTIKASSYYLRDKIKSKQNFENKYFLAADTITNIDVTEINKLPITYQADVRLRYTISAKSLFEIVTSYLHEKSTVNTTGLSNFIPNYKTILQSDNSIKKIIATYTIRLNKRQALQVEGRYFQNRIPQEYNVEPSVYKRGMYISDKQLGLYSKQYVEGTVSIHGVTNKTKYNFFFKNISNRSEYGGKVSNDSLSTLVASFINDIQYTNNALTHGASFSTENGSWRLQTGYTISYFSQNLFNTQRERAKNILFEPSFKVTFRLSKTSSTFGSYSLTQKPETEEHLFQNNILQDFRNVIQNRPALDIFRTHNFNLNYSRIDLYNQFDNSLGVFLNCTVKGYLPFYQITDSLIYTNFSVSKVNRKSVGFYFSSAKYISDLHITAKVALNYSVSHYNNIVGIAALRENKRSTTTGNLLFKSVYNGRINFENNFNYFISHSDNIGTNSVSNKIFQNNFTIIYKSKKMMRMFVNCDYYLPSSTNKEKYVFFDYNLVMRKRKGYGEYKITLMNLFNVNRITVSDISDFSQSYFTSNSFPRHISFSWIFQF